jgi:hypothetical protein
MGKTQGLAALLSVASIIAVATTAGGPQRARAQAGPSLRVDPPSQTVSTGATFAVKIVQNAPFETAGSQTDLVFNPTIMQIQDVQLGVSFAQATFIIGSGAVDLPTAIADANGTGTLVGIAAFLAPGSGTAPPGDQDFAIVTMQATAEGTSPLSLSGVIQMIDAQGACYGCPTDINPAASKGPVNVTNGQVTVGGAGAPAGGTTPGAVTTPGAAQTAAPSTTARTSPTVATTAQAIGTPSTPAPTVQARSGSVSVSPDTQKVAVDGTFSVQVMRKTDGPIANAEIELKFKNSLVEITKIELAAGFKGASADVLAAAATDANKTGTLTIPALSYTSAAASVSGTPAASGTGATANEGPVLTVTLQAHSGKNGTTKIELSKGELSSRDGTPITTTITSGEAVIGSGSSGSGSSMILVIVGIIAVLAVAGGGAFVYMRQRGGA